MHARHQFSSFYVYLSFYRIRNLILLTSELSGSKSVSECKPISKKNCLENNIENCPNRLIKG